MRSADIIAATLIWLGAASALGSADLPFWMSERRIQGDNDLEPIENTLGTNAYEFARIVARVETRSGEGYCTGFRVAEDLFMTNHHCYDFNPCKDVSFRMAYERDTPEADQRLFHCIDVISKSQELDYALFRVTLAGDAEGEPANDDIKNFPIATLWNGPMEPGQALILPSHPRARPKEIDRGVFCKLLTATPEEEAGRSCIRHTCDTEGKSSGSPIMDRQSGAVLALHWGGSDDYNVATTISDIIAHLQESLPPQDFQSLQIAE